MKKLLITFLVFFALPATASASIYVKPTGDDATCSEGSSVTACATPARALSLVTNGQTVYCLPGEYPLTVVNRAFTGATRLHGNGCVLDGLTTSSTSANFVASYLTVNGNTNIAGKNISLFHTSHTNHGGTCIRIRGANNAQVDSSFVHDCKRGIDSPYTGNSTPATAHDDSVFVTVKNTTITDMAEDGIAIGDWSNVLISNNTLTHLVDPCRAIGDCLTNGACPHAGGGREACHNDGIQFFGGVHSVTITHNKIDDSSSQGMLLQSAGSNIPNTDISVDDNVVTNIGGVALQADDSGVLAFDQNILCGTLGSLWVWPKVVNASVSVTNNQLSSPWVLKSGSPVPTVTADVGNTTPCS